MDPILVFFASLGAIAFTFKWGRRERSGDWDVLNTVQCCSGKISLFKEEEEISCSSSLLKEERKGDLLRTGAALTQLEFHFFNEDIMGERSTGMNWEQGVFRKVHFTMHELITLLGKASLKKAPESVSLFKREKDLLREGRTGTHWGRRALFWRGGGGGLCTLKSTAPSQSQKCHPIPKCECRCIIFTNTKTNANEKTWLDQSCTDAKKNTCTKPSR